MITHLIFIRHGEAEGNLYRRFHGHYNSELTENGKRQVGLLAERLKNREIDVIYSSDLKRAFETAKAVADVKGMPIFIDEGLREIRGGQWEDVPFAELPEKFPESFDQWTNAPHDLVLPGGESMREFQDRLVRTVEKIVKKNEGETILIATHGTAIRALVCYFYNEPLEYINNIVWYDNASITEILVDEGSFRVVTEGDNEHLGEHTTLGKQSWWRKGEPNDD